MEWYRTTKRDLPWRRVRDPYAIWVSEIMCQQTQIETVLPFYGRWMERLPTVENLAAASEEEVLGLWQGLGYYRRARMLQAGARQVVERGWPQNAHEWREISGVGDYTAGAIASIALGEPAALVDGNVARVLARFYARRESGAALLKWAWPVAREWVDRESPGDWNQALMELGALVCTPQKPQCQSCPLRPGCSAVEQGLTAEIPTPKPRPKVVELEWRVILTEHAGAWAVNQIPAGEWWEGMWEFPTERESAAPDRSQRNESSSAYLGSISHTVTHHRIRVEVWRTDPGSQGDGFRWVTGEELSALPMPALQRKAFRLLDGAQKRLF